MIVVMLLIAGLIFGSFINALVWRLKEQEELREQIAGLPSKKSSAKQARLLEQELRARSMLHGRSMCSHCHHELAAKDLVPVFSWVVLRGKCRYCGIKIEDNPLVELVTAILFALSYLWWPLAVHGIGLFQLIVWLGFVIGFVALAVYDLRWFILPNRIVLPFVALAVVEALIVAVWKHDAWFIIDAVGGAVTLSGIFYVLFILSDGAWIGGGDVKLAIVLGILAGSPIQSLLVLFFASIIGTLFSIPILLKGRKGLKMQVPFGPYLLAGTFVVVLFGHAIINWYTNLLPY